MCVLVTKIDQILQRIIESTDDRTLAVHGRLHITMKLNQKAVRTGNATQHGESSLGT